MHYNIQRPLVEMKKAFSGYKIGSPRTRETYYFVITLIIKDFFYLKHYFDSFYSVRLEHVQVLMKHWEKKSLSNVTIGSRLSILRKYLAILKHDINLPTNVELGLSRKKVISGPPKAIDMNKLFQTVKHPLTQLILKLQICFGLTKEEAVKFKIQLYPGNNKVLYVSKLVSYNNKDRLIRIYSAEQELILTQLLDEIGLHPSLSEKYSKAALMNFYHAELGLYEFSSKISFRATYARNIFDYLVHQQMLSHDEAITQIAQEMGLPQTKTIKKWLSHE